MRRSRTFDATGALVNADAATGELVNTNGSGMFRGYHNDQGATDERLRHGMYWSGDLAYRDADGWIYLAGRTADWMRVDGENITAAPIERILLRQPVISRRGGLSGARRIRRRPGDGRHRACATVSELTPDAARRVPRRLNRICRPRPGHATSGSPTICPAPRPTRSSSASWSALGADPAGRVLWKRDGTVYTHV